MGLNDAVQALKKADTLKEKVENCQDLLNDGDAWVWQQQLQRIYQQVLLQDLEYALDCKVEQDLWNYGFKNYICTLQNMVKDKKNPKRIESQAMLTWCLEAASGFYLTLLQEICTAFDLDLSCRRRDSVYGISDNFHAASLRHLAPNKTSSSYICQHCLVHLGDIARYRNQNRQAESFYRHAVQLSPHSGQPYNQLALLDSSRGDRLGTVFHYVRSVTVKHPFPAAATNLKRMFTKFAEDQLNLDGRTKLTVQEYVALFLKFHGLLYLSADVTPCNLMIRLLTDTLTAQVATESFTSRKLVQMLAVNLFALHRARGHIFLAENDKQKEKQEVKTERYLSNQKQAKSLVLDLMAGSLSALLLPVYTIRESEALLEYFALPAIKLTLDWIQFDPQILNDPAFTSRLQIWPSLCKLLNGLQSVQSESVQSNKISSIPLPEDRELHGFLPLSMAMGDLLFNCQDSKIDSLEANRLRASRLVKFGVWLSKQEENAVITSRELQSSSNDYSIVTFTFEAIASGQTPSSELLKELEQLSLGVGQGPEQPSPSPSDAGSWGGSSTSTPGGAISPTLLPPVVLEQVAQVAQIAEKRTGILKPQGSLEKSREREMTETGDGLIVGSGRRAGRQNIAMQTILRKGVTLPSETDVKQVSFKTPSPTTIGHKDSWSNQKLKAVQPQPVNSQSSSLSSGNGFPATDFTQPPPPLQQLQQQAQARVVNVPPPPLFPLPPMSVPPPSIRPNVLDVNSHNFTVPDNHMNIQPPFRSWQEEPPLQVAMSDPSSRSPWWPAGQMSSQGTSARGAPAQPSGNLYNDVSNWGMMHQSQGNSQQQIQFQRPPSQLPHPSQKENRGLQTQPLMLSHPHVGPLHPPHSGSIPRPHELQDKREGLGHNIQGFSPYSLFSTNNWLSPSISSGHGIANAEAKASIEYNKDDSNQSSRDGRAAIMGTQSLWSGPGPSPLERLLEQQKHLRDGPSPKTGT